MTTTRLMSSVFLIAALGYAAISFGAFTMPATITDAQGCGFSPDEFVSAGTLTYDRTHAWAISFVRKQEYFTAITIGLTAAFLAFGLKTGRRGGKTAAGVAAGSGVLAVSALCISCVGPALSIVGLSVAGGFLANVPKALIAANTLLLTAWGTLFLSRRTAHCTLRTTNADAACNRLAQTH
ncbi:hypothetical protein [Caballeronia sp. ATUFL_M1_KS5A]|uniref:hypothetical protein n=1 Tax=Caballeronia sp. ATUFL_M1_KS5A TaxID=2921778 RepID=UPI002027D5A9|nr:hypothetical protein [Caballeronia sp. ATUFL_M1_KS5A]